LETWAEEVLSPITHGFMAMLISLVPFTWPVMPLFTRPIPVTEYAETSVLLSLSASSYVFSFNLLSCGTTKGGGYVAVCSC